MKAGATNGMKRVAVFDIDGTLTDTNAVDDECFVSAAAQVFGFDAQPIDWSLAPHVTDAALLRWVCEQQCGRPARDAEVENCRRLFYGLLAEQLSASPHRFRPIPGAGDVFERVRSAGWGVAVATGGWETSARMKLRAIGIGHEGLALASSSDASTRTEIITVAIERLTGAGRGALERVVSLGDGVWDVRAAAELGVPFIGIGSGAAAERLRAAGAALVLEDLSDTARLCAALESATAPERR